MHNALHALGHLNVFIIVVGSTCTSPAETSQMSLVKKDDSLQHQQDLRLKHKESTGGAAIVSQQGYHSFILSPI